MLEDPSVLLNTPDTQVITWQLNELPLTLKFIDNWKRTVTQGLTYRDNKEDFRSGQPIKDLGFKFHMNDISSAIGIGNMPYVRGCIEQNRELAQSGITHYI